MNCFGLGDNYCLWIMIILLILCVCKNGCLTGIIEKLCNCGCLLPLLLVWCCCCKGDTPTNYGFGGGCGK